MSIFAVFIYSTQSGLWLWPES